MTQATQRRGRRPVTAITPHQRRTLKLIDRYTRRHGRPPTIQELAGELGISGPSVHGQVTQLVRKGFLAREEGKARGLRVVRRPSDDVADLVTVPVVGVVAAGRPLLAEENIVGEVLVDGHLAEGSRCFGLRVRGDSMLRAKICNGDLVIVRQQPIAENGEIVVALVNGEATVKRFYMSDDRIELRPDSPKHKPIRIGSDTDLRIVGKVVGVRRVTKISR